MGMKQQTLSDSYRWFTDRHGVLHHMTDVQHVTCQSDVLCNVFLGMMFSVLRQIFCHIRFTEGHTLVWYGKCSAMLTDDSQTNNLTSMWGRSHSQSQIIAKLTVNFSFSPCAANSTVRLTIPVWPLHTSLLTVMVTSNLTCRQQKYRDDACGDDDDNDNGGDDNDGFKKDPFQAPHLQTGQSKPRQPITVVRHIQSQFIWKCSAWIQPFKIFFYSPTALRYICVCVCVCMHVCVCVCMHVCVYVQIHVCFEC